MSLKSARDTACATLPSAFTLELQPRLLWSLVSFASSEAKLESRVIPGPLAGVGGWVGAVRAAVASVAHRRRSFSSILVRSFAVVAAAAAVSGRFSATPSGRVCCLCQCVCSRPFYASCCLRCCSRAVARARALALLRAVARSASRCCFALFRTVALRAALPRPGTLSPNTYCPAAVRS